MERNKEKIIKRDFKIVQKIRSETLKTKLFFFINDVSEKNKRLNLNFGHTFAHAIEMALNFKNKKDFIQHGEAVGLGILCEIFYSNILSNFDFFVFYRFCFFLILETIFIFF